MRVSETTCTVTTIRPAEKPGSRDGYGVIRSGHVQIAIPFSRVPETADSAFNGADSRLIPGLPSLASVPTRPPWRGRCAGAHRCFSWDQYREPSGWKSPRTAPARRLARVPCGHPRLPRYGPPGGSVRRETRMHRHGHLARRGRVSAGRLWVPVAWAGTASTDPVTNRAGPRFPSCRGRCPPTPQGQASSDPSQQDRNRRQLPQ